MSPGERQGRGRDRVWVVLLLVPFCVSFAAATLARAAFPGHNGRLVFSGCGSCEGDDDAELFTVGRHGHHFTRLTKNARWDMSPSFSPDGSKVVFSCHGGFRVSSRSRELCVMNADGSGRRRITHNDVADLEPTWSPDGEHVAFLRGWGADAEIYVIDVDGTDERAVTSNEYQEFSPDWSPDGSAIAFVTVREERNQEIYAIAPDGTDERNLTNSAETEDAPDWSPDGTQIAFQRGLDSGPTPGWNVFVSAADGSNVRRITNGERPAWSPNQRWIAFSDNGIFKVRTDGSDRMLVVKDSTHRLYWGVDWQPLP